MGTWPEGRFRAGEKWEECDRCGFFYPESSITDETTPDGKGLRVCTNIPDKDDPNPRDRVVLPRND